MVNFFLKYFFQKNWRGGGELFLKNGTMDGFAYGPYYCLDQITLCRTLALWGFLQHLSAEYRRPKKVLPSEHGASGTVPYGESGPGYCIMFIKI